MLRQYRILRSKRYLGEVYGSVEEKAVIVAEGEIVDSLRAQPHRMFRWEDEGRMEEGGRRKEEGGRRKKEGGWRMEEGGGKEGENEERMRACIPTSLLIKAISGGKRGEEERRGQGRGNVKADSFDG
eukprot:355333-Rhodomonas_salina.3